MSPAFNQSNNTSLSVSELFDVNRIPNALPSCEIGGLRACECDPKKGITLKQRYLALSTVLHASETEALKCGYRIGFLTCIGTPTLQRLYQDRFGFNEVAEVSYGGSVTWKALCRLR